MLTVGRKYANDALLRGICVLPQQLLWDCGELRETMIEMVALRTFLMRLTPSQKAGIKHKNSNVSPYRTVALFEKVT
jgi:hypothetical protein